jgi:hypothetical protein
MKCVVGKRNDLSTHVTIDVDKLLESSGKQTILRSKVSYCSGYSPWLLDNLFFVAHNCCPLVSSQLKVVDSTREVERSLQLGSHIVSRDLAPYVRLTPVHPSSSHLERVVANVGGPGPSAYAVTSLNQEDPKTCSVQQTSISSRLAHTSNGQVASRRETGISGPDNDDIPRR